MKLRSEMLGAFAVSVIAILPLGAHGAATSAPGGGELRVTLPFDLVDVLDGAKFKIRVPANWNGSLLVYVQGTKSGAAPPEPIVAPLKLPGSDAPLEGTLLARGYALAASEVSTLDWQIKASVQDTLALTAYFRARVGEPKRVILWGNSLGGLVTIRMLEDYPRSFDGGIALSAPALGFCRRYDALLDVSLAYAAAFGWPEDAWGPVGNPKSGLNFTTEVNPKVNWPKPDGSNRGGWEFIRMVNGLAPESFWQTDPITGYTGFFLQIYFAVMNRAGAQDWAGGPVAQNGNHQYTLTRDEKQYLAGLGLQPDELLARMNSQTEIQASARARDYVGRFADPRGALTKPMLTLHTTMDALADVRYESAYRKMVEDAGAPDWLVQAFVPVVGHNGFTAAQILAALAAMESWLDNGAKPGAAAFPESLGFDNKYVPPPYPY